MQWKIKRDDIFKIFNYFKLFTFSSIFHYYESFRYVTRRFSLEQQAKEIYYSKVNVVKGCIRPFYCLVPSSRKYSFVPKELDALTSEKKK